MVDHRFKAQSAMEYLMTYGWAIIIIAVVLGALFSLGVFSGNAFLPTACIAASGYECLSPLLHVGVLSFTFGQNTGTTWTSGNVLFIPTGKSYTGNAGNQYSLGALSSGGSTTVSISNVTTWNSIGYSLTGTLYVNYSTSAASHLVAEVGTISVKGS